MPSKVFSRFLLYGARPGGNTMKTVRSTQYFSPRCTWLVRSAAGLIAAIAALTAIPQKANAGVFIGVGVSVGFPPPVLPVYVQPPIPAAGYIWTPGYWAWNGADYYWVPGTWVLAPYYGALWTPGYWGWTGGVYVFHAGYWGPHVGFYGGVNYGYGYGGSGYVGGHWGTGGFYYNRSVNQFGGVHVTNVYNQTIVNNTYVSRTSYNGGQGGLSVRATPQEAAFEHEQHIGPVAAQQRQMTMASQNHALFASVNHGNPPIAATARAGVFAGAGVVAARGAAGHFAPAAANVQHLNSNAAVRSQANGTALRSANFAPHANTANVTHTNGNAYHPASVSHANYTAHTAQTRTQSTGYRPAAAPQYHAAAQSYRPPAAHPASSAPRGGGAPHGGGEPHGGGGRDQHHG
jgi:WXXGXW repeat (2 copies)